VAFIYACSGDETTPANTPDASADATPDVVAPDTGSDSGNDAALDASDGGSPNAVVQLAPGGNHTCALLASGDVWCWGGNDLGQLALGTFDTNVHVPAKVANLPPIVAIASGNHHTCALDGTGAEWCWGSNQIMQLGHDPIVDSGADGGDVVCTGSIPCNGKPRVVTGLAAAKAIGALVFNSCARLASGDVKCWGWNGSGLAGHSPPDLPCFYGNVCTFTPGTVASVPAGPFALGSGYACVLSSGAVSCWGDNSQSQLGLAPDTNPHVAPISIGGLPSITSISAGQSTPYAMGPGGAVYGWGYNANGEATPGACDAGSVMAPSVVFDAGMKEVAGGSGFGCALSTGGTVSCWGNDLHGQLGPAVDAGPLTKCQTPATITGLAQVTRLTVGFAHVCALKSDNTVWCWGYNNIGQVGHDPAIDPSSNCSGKCATTPSQVTGLP
jgi:alpha-tubulin suppressor-like RCC1 family protein